MIRIAENECYVMYTFFIHVIYGITSASAYPNHFDDLR